MPNIGSRLYPCNGIHGKVVHELGREIVTGFYRPGEKLPGEAEFIERFRGSRTAIREAFRVLSAKGLLEARQRAGTRVRARRFWNLLDPDILAWQSLADNNRQSVLQMMEFRAVFEPAIARMVAERATTDQIDILSEIHRAMEISERNGDRRRLSDTVREFHISLYDACSNDYAERLKDVIGVVLDYLYDRQDDSYLRNGVARWHFLILDRIKMRDGVGAEELIRTLIAKESELLNLSLLKVQHSDRKAVA